MSLDLYRVGEPSIGETYGHRWNRSRGSGGLGTGVYAFRTREAADDNAERNGDEVLKLPSALDNPVQPSTLDATKALNDLSRRLAWLKHDVGNGEVTWDYLLENPNLVRVSLSNMFNKEYGYGDGDSLRSDAFTILLQTTQLREKYGLDEERFVLDALKATRKARMGEDAVQPINHLLYPEFDGVAPYSGAGGDSGTYGCVVFKEVIDNCVGYSTTESERIDTRKLIDCFAED